MKNKQSERLFSSLTDVDARFIEEAQTPVRSRKTYPFIKWGALAACLCLVVGGALMWNNLREQPAVDGGPVAVPGEGVVIPPVQVDLSADTAASMVPFFIYQGRCYTQYERLEKGAPLVGEYLGTATGLIDEWTPESGYVELAGSVQGDFYAVNGYDPAFMLCMRQGEEIALYICNNGITLQEGADLYEDRLHLTENYSAVTYESRDSWYHSSGEIQPLDAAENSVLADFVTALNAAEFMASSDVPLDAGEDSLADRELYHLYFELADGMTVHLRLCAGGYVRFEGILDVCVQIPQEVFDSLIQQLDVNA